MDNNDEVKTEEKDLEKPQAPRRNPDYPSDFSVFILAAVIALAFIVFASQDGWLAGSIQQLFFDDA